MVKKDENVEYLATQSISMTTGLLLVSVILFASAGVCGKFALLAWAGGLVHVFILFSLAMSYEEYKSD